MKNKLFKCLPIPLIIILFLSFSFFFVGCGKNNNNDNNNNSNNNDNNDNTSSTNTIPDSNVYEDLAAYIVKNGQQATDKYYKDTDVHYSIRIAGDADNFIDMSYSPTRKVLGLLSLQKAIGGFRLLFSKDTDYSKEYHSMTLIYPYQSNVKLATIAIPSTKFVDMNTTTNLIDIASFYKPSSITEEEKNTCYKNVFPKISEGLMEFSKFYANTVKQNSQYLGATYKYFYLPVV